MGLLSIADKLLQNPRKRGGLLQCSLHFINNPAHSVESPGREKSEQIRLFLADYDENIADIKSEVELANYTAALFVKHLELEQLAWFMFDPVTDCYLPWIAHGFNKAVREKMVFPPDQIKQLVAASSLLELTGEKMDFFRDYFNPATGSALQRIVILPLCYLDTLLGFILTVNLKPEYTADARFNRFLANSAPAQTVIGERYSKISIINKYNINPGEPLAEAMEPQLEYALKNNTVFSILKLELEAVIAPVLAEDTNLNALIIKEDILLLLGQLFKHIGSVYNLKNGIFLFALNKLRKIDLAVLKDQLLKTMESFFAEIIKTGNFNLDFQVVTYPADGETIRDMLSVIL